MAEEQEQIPLEDLVFFEEGLEEFNREKEAGRIDSVDPNADPNDPNGNTDTTSQGDSREDDGDDDDGEPPIIEDTTPPDGDGTEDNTDDDAGDDTPPSGEKDQIAKYYEFLSGQGLLSVGEDFEFDGSVEKFQEAVEKTKENSTLAGAEAIMNALPEDFRLVVNYALSGGTDINEVVSQMNNSFSLENLDLEKVEDQKAALERYYKKTTRFSDKKIQKNIARLIEDEESEEEAEYAFEELKKIDKEEKTQLIQTQANQKKVEDAALQQAYTGFVDMTKANKGWSGKRKQAIIDSIWTVGKYGKSQSSYFDHIDSQVKSNPEHLAQLADIYLDYDPSKGFGKSKRVKQKNKTEVVSNFREQLNNALSTNFGNTQPVTPKTTGFDLEGWISKNN